MAEADYEKTSYGAFERFLYLFFIPVIFTAILTIVMLSVFDYNVMNTFLKIGNKIPIVANMVPEPPAETAADPEVEVPDVNSEELTIMLNQAEEDLRKAVESSQQKDQQIKELQAQMTALQEQLQNKTLSDEEYLLRIQKLAGVYAEMTPSKAAPILENLTLNEQVLVLNEMKQENQIKVLEKMNPQKAAEASILLKDQVLVKDAQIAALQERLAIHNDEQTSTILTHNELALTFSNMTPVNAANVLMQMLKTNETMVIEILRSMDVQSRSAVISSIAGQSESEAASISAKLGQ
jgi:flagellar motility protein MotE (MotC chaperone)